MGYNLRMKRGDYTYIWQWPEWPNWQFDLGTLTALLMDVSRTQGLLLGRLADVGMGLRDQVCLAVLTEDVVKTSEIEGEHLEAASVRSSIARRLGVDIGGLTPVDRHADGVVEMILDATGNCAAPLTLDRLYGWHAALFPTEYSGLQRIRTGALRDDANGPMRLVSGPLQRQRIDFEAPPAECLLSEMNHFLDWANNDTSMPLLIKAGVAHLWFVTLHPFDDGNGRIARAIGDLFLARADGVPQRFYSVSAQLQQERRGYYEKLEHTQKGTLEITPWLTWFLTALNQAIVNAQVTLEAVLVKSRFWQQWAATPMNERQIKLLNRLLDGFEGRLTSSKWAAIANCSPDTALRDIHELVDLGIMRKTQGGGRSTGYELNP